MTDINLITDAMVEAARALLAAEGADSQDGWHSWRCFDKVRYPEPCDCTAQAARSALEAAAPLIAAEAWEEGYQACRNRPRVDGYLINRANPHQTRADRIERGES